MASRKLDTLHRASLWLKGGAPRAVNDLTVPASTLQDADWNYGAPSDPRRRTFW